MIGEYDCSSGLPDSDDQAPPYTTDKPPVKVFDGNMKDYLKKAGSKVRPESMAVGDGATMHFTKNASGERVCVIDAGPQCSTTSDRTAPID